MPAQQRLDALRALRAGEVVALDEVAGELREALPLARLLDPEVVPTLVEL
jgi:hypothetical protein